jgi:hypothetical protein
MFQHPKEDDASKWQPVGTAGMPARGLSLQWAQVGGRPLYLNLSLRIVWPAHCLMRVCTLL